MNYRGLAALIMSVLVTPAWGQDVIIELEDKPARGFHGNGGIDYGTVRRFKTDAEAQEVVDKIRGVLPIRDRIFAIVSNDSNAVPNAEARFDKNKRRVVGFNKAYMQRLRAETGTYWAMVGIAAHEVGHHAANHTLLPDKCGDNESYELDADFHAGFALGKMHVKIDDAVATMRLLPTTGVKCSHPGQQQRIAVLKEGWQMATSAVAVALTEVSAKKVVATVRAAAAVTPQTPFKLRKSRDVFGHDIERLPGVSIQACAARCEAQPRCKGFSFDRWNGWCFLKDAMTESYLEPRSVIGVRSSATFPTVSTAPAEMYRIRNKRFIDKPNQIVAATSYEACTSTCNSDINCIAFSYEKQTKGCGIHSEVSGYIFDTAFDGGYKQQPPAGGVAAQTSRMEVTRNSYFEGHGYKREEDVTLEVCTSRCQSATRCVAIEFTERDGICRLYDKVEKPQPAKGTHIAFKRN